jgi:hypothetical protein
VNTTTVMNLIQQKAAASINPQAFVPTPDSRPEMFLSGVVQGNSGLRIVDFVEPGLTGHHPKMSVRINREGCVPTAPVFFYRQ